MTPSSAAERLNDRGSSPAQCAVEGEVVVTVWRGGWVENRHRAHVAVTTATGALVAAVGDAARLTLVRSTVKPAQALTVLESSPELATRLDARDLALLCASHSAEPLHLQQATELLRKLALAESDLRCGGHPSLSDAVNRDWIRRGITPSAVCSNCSGKHIGQAAAARALTGSPADYHHFDHPIQGRVRQTLSELIELPVADIGWAIDGCNLPTPALPLQRLAMLYARLAQAADEVAQATFAGSAQPTARTQAMARLFTAMNLNSELVAGTGRFCTTLMTAYPGILIGKVGADGCYAAGLRAQAGDPLDDRAQALGVAVKVEDGNTLMVQAIVCEVLRQLQVPWSSELSVFHAPPIVNTVGQEVGHLEISLRLSAPIGD